MKNNFKRCLALLLAIMTIVGAFSIPVSAAGECTHNWEMKDKKDPTCATQGYESWFCTLCQKYEVRNITSRLDHEYVFVVAEKQPTCSVDGHPAEAYVCKNGCGNYYVERTMTDAEKALYTKKPALPSAGNFNPATDLYHKWGAPTVDGEACVNKEYDVTYTCEYCDGKVVIKKDDGAGFHVFGDPVLVKVPTCSVAGSAKRTCVTCGYSETLEIAKIAHQHPVDADGKPAVTYKKYTQTDASKSIQHSIYTNCVMCGKDTKWYNKDLTAASKNAEVKIDCFEKGQGWELDGNPSTCSYLATYKRECEICKGTQTRKDWKQPFHQYSANVYTRVEGEHTATGQTHAYNEYTCTTCNAKFKIYDGYNVTRNETIYGDNTPGGVNEKDDSLHGDARRYVPKFLNDHDWKTTSYKVDPTCTQKGAQGWECADPDCPAVRITEIAVKHSYDLNANDYRVVIVPATCTTKGSEDFYCTRCDKKWKTNTTINALTSNSKHKSGNDLVWAGDPNLLNGKYLAGTFDAEKILEEQIKQGLVLANCFEDGVRFKVCPVCNTKQGSTSTYSVANKSDHWHRSGADYGEYYGTGCFDDRYYLIECKYAGCGEVRKVVVLANQGAHDFSGNLVTINEATCYTKGLVGYKCQRADCGEIGNTTLLDYAPDYHPNANRQVRSELVANNKYVAEAGKTWTDVQPTLQNFNCVDTKYEWIYCEDCHRNYRRAFTVEISNGDFVAKIDDTTITQYYYNGKVINVADYATIAAVSGTHTKIYAILEAPTCDKTGKGIEICLMCDYRVEDAIVPMIAHKKSANKVDASDLTTVVTGSVCYKDIAWRQQCTECKQWLWNGTFKASAHSFIDSNDTTDSVNKFLDGLSNWEWLEDKDGNKIVATCKSDAEQRRYCVNDGCEYYESRIIAKSTVAHTKGAQIQNGARVEATCNKPGQYEHVKCAVCDTLCYVDGSNVKATTTIKTIAALGHQSGIDGVVVAPDCTNFGYTAVVCKRAGCKGVTDDVAGAPAKVLSYKAYQAPVGHKYDKDADRTKVEATCSTWEYTYIPCEVCKAECDKVDNKDVAKKMHLNKNGDILTGSCQLVLHNVDCVDCKAAGTMCSSCQSLYVCVNAIAWDKDGKATAYCKDYEVDGVKINPILPTHNYVETAYVSCNVVKSTCSVCGDVAWNNEEGDDSVKVYHKYAVKVEPTIYAAGVEACTVCGYENPAKVPQIVALEFSMDFYNPLDPTGPIVNGGKVYVRINMNAIEPIILSDIRLALAYNVDDLVFVGAVDNKSYFGELAVANAKDGIVYVFDDAGKERFNVDVEGEAEFVTLEFYVRPTAYNIGVGNKDSLDSIISFVESVDFADPKEDDFIAEVSYYDFDKADYGKYAFDITTNNRVNLNIDRLGDFNNNGRIDSADLSAVRDLMIDMINGVEGAVYNAILDIDHDGEIDMDDYGYIKELMVNKYTYWQFADLASYNEFVAYEKENGVSKEDKELELSELQRYAKWLGPVAPPKV